MTSSLSSGAILKNTLSQSWHQWLSLRYQTLPGKVTLRVTPSCCTDSPQSHLPGSLTWNLTWGSSRCTPSLACPWLWPLAYQWTYLEHLNTSKKQVLSTVYRRQYLAMNEDTLHSTVILSSWKTDRCCSNFMITKHLLTLRTGRTLFLFHKYRSKTSLSCHRAFPSS